MNETVKSAITTDYLDGYQYNNASLKFFPTAEGYVEPSAGSYKYVYQYKDHLGNIRLSYEKTLAIKEENNYYHFGLKHEGYNNVKIGVENKYKYNGKELQDELGLNIYDYGARNYDPAIGRWMNIDPLAEKFSNMSPYVYGLNDPTNVIDPDGMDGIRVIDDKNKTITVRANYYVQTEARTYYTPSGRAKTFDGYSTKDISKMQKRVNRYLNDSKNNTVSEGEYAGYKVVYDLQFKDGGTVEKAREMASNDKINGDSVGNTIERSSAIVTPYFATKENKPDADGNVTTSTVGGVTQDNKNVTMNSSQDTLMNRVHEIFHTFGFTHPKGTGGTQGIMNYPSKDVSKTDVNQIANNNFLPKQ